MSFEKPPATHGFPLLQAVREHPVALLQVAGICLIPAVSFYLAFFYIVTWLKLYAQMKASVALEINSFNMAIMLVVILGVAWLSDKIGRRPILVAGAVGLALFSWPAMALMQTGSVTAVFLGQLVFVILIGSYNAVLPLTICEAFPKAVRCTAVSTAYNFTVGIAGGTTPMFSTWLIAETDYPLAPAVYATLAAVVSVAAVIWLSRSAVGHSVETETHIDGLAATASTGR